MAAPQEPTVNEIRDILIANIESRLGQSVPLLPKAVWRVLAIAIAGIFVILYKFGSFQFLQIFPQTAGEEFLERWGNLVDINRSPAEGARIEIQCTGENGQVILTSSRIVNNLNGVVYLVDADATIVGGVAITTMIATKSGEIGNVSNGKVLSFVTPINGIDNKCTVTDTIDVGIDKENLDIYRGRVVDRFQKPPQGGAFTDYEQWAKEVATIINAYIYSGETEGTVEVFIESDAGVDGIPSAGEITQVEDSINQVDRRPVTAELFVLPIIRTPFKVKVFGLVPNTPGDDLTDAKASILSFLTQYFLNGEPFIEGLSVINKSVLAQTEVIEIISLSLQTKNASFDTATFEVSGSGDLQTRFNLGQGEKSKLDSVEYF